MSPAKLKALLGADLKLIARDHFLLFLLAYPLVLATIARFLLPIAAEELAGRLDLPPYYPLINAYFFLLISPLVYGVLTGLILLDERDDDTLRALYVTPLAQSSYMGYRLVAPYLLAIVYAVLQILILDLHDAPFWFVWPVALSAAFTAPFFALLLASIASNKVEGLALMKALGVFLVAPCLDWFFDGPLVPLLGIFPTYWPIKAYWLGMDGIFDMRFWGALLVGAAYLCLLTWLLLQRFYAKALD